MGLAELWNLWNREQKLEPHLSYFIAYLTDFFI